MWQYANVPITVRDDSVANWHIGILTHCRIIYHFTFIEALIK